MDKGKFATSKDAKAAGWYSRRHETSQARSEAFLKYRDKVNENKAPKS